MKIKIFKQIVPTLLVAAFITACSSDDVSQSGQGNNTGKSTSGVVFTGETQAPVSRSGNTLTGGLTRTTATHTIGSGAKAFWETNDKVWVKDDGSTFQQSSAPTFPVATNKANAMFSLTGTFTGTTHAVVYTGKNGTSANEVEIKAVQSSAMKTFDKLGENGDCGIATANKVATNQYKFELQHKASYLCFYPRIQNNALHKNVRLEKIVITSTSGPIAGKYAFSETNGLGSSPTPTASSSNTITVNIGSGAISLKTAKDTCYYAVIAPGSHTLKVDYYIKDPQTLTTAVAVSKNIGTMTCTPGQINDISAWIDKDIHNYSNRYYMWDANTANDDYWHGHYDKQPTMAGGTDPTTSYPTVATDWRWYNTSAYPAQATPGRTAGSAPSVNGLRWLTEQGDSHFDNTTVWSLLGHLYHNGAWFKRPDKIVGYTETHAPNGTDYRSTGDAHRPFSYSHTGVPGNRADYFFLPIVGWYESGTAIDMGTRAGYWSSSSRPEAGYSYVLYLTTTGGDVSSPYWHRWFGLKVLNPNGID